MATEEPFLQETDNVTKDFRYRGFMYDKQNPRIPVTGPIGFRGKEEGKKFPLPRSLIQGKPVPPTTKPKGFFFGSENVREMSDEERRERRINLRLLNKTSADLRKLKKAQDEQVQFLQEHRLARKEQERKRREEQEQDMTLLKTYYPFGKPGYGAPLESGMQSQKRSFKTENGIGILLSAEDSPPKIDWKKVVPPGAPERPRVRRYEDDRMRRYAVDRETAEQYKRELDELRHIKKQNEDKIRSLDLERERHSLGYDPFGRPGAGAPNRDDKGRSHTKRSISISYVTDPVDARHAERLRRRTFGDVSDDGKPAVARHYKHVSPPRHEDPMVYDPWEKDMRRKDEKGNILRLPRAGDHGIYEFVDPNIPAEVFPRKHIGGGGEPLVDKNGDKLTKRMGLLTTIHGARRSENIPRVATPDQVQDKDRGRSPWGRPGAGAPLTDDTGNIVKNTKGTIDRERENLSQTEASRRARAKELYRSQLQEGMTVQRHLRDEEKEFIRKPAGDVPSWFSKGKVGRPTRDPETGLIQPQKRVMSDVTAQKLAADRPRDVESYYKELQEQAEERKRMRIQEKERIAKLEEKPFPYRVVAPWAIES